MVMEIRYELNANALYVEKMKCEQGILILVSLNNE
jgi:hypothetical protein